MVEVHDAGLIEVLVHIYDVIDLRHVSVCIVCCLIEYSCAAPDVLLLVASFH